MIEHPRPRQRTIGRRAFLSRLRAASIGTLLHGLPAVAQRQDAQDFRDLLVMPESFFPGTWEHALWKLEQAFAAQDDSRVRNALFRLEPYLRAVGPTVYDGQRKRAMRHWREINRAAERYGYLVFRKTLDDRAPLDPEPRFEAFRWRTDARGSFVTTIDPYADATAYATPDWAPIRNDDFVLRGPAPAVGRSISAIVLQSGADVFADLFEVIGAAARDAEPAAVSQLLDAVDRLTEALKEEGGETDDTFMERSRTFLDWELDRYLAGRYAMFRVRFVDSVSFTQLYRVVRHEGDVFYVRPVHTDHWMSGIFKPLGWVKVDGRTICIDQDELDDAALGWSVGPGNHPAERVRRIVARHWNVLGGEQRVALKRASLLLHERDHQYRLLALSRRHLPVEPTLGARGAQRERQRAMFDAYLEAKARIQPLEQPLAYSSTLAVGFPDPVAVMLEIHDAAVSLRNRYAEDFTFVAGCALELPSCVALLEAVEAGGTDCDELLERLKHDSAERRDECLGRLSDAARRIDRGGRAARKTLERLSCAARRAYLALLRVWSRRAGIAFDELVLKSPLYGRLTTPSATRRSPSLPWHP